MALQILLIIPYFLLTGFLVQYFFFREGDHDVCDRTLYSLLFSISINSIVLYGLVRIFEMQMTAENITIMILILAGLICAIGTWKVSVDQRQQQKGR